MFLDFWRALRSPALWLFTTGIQFLILYRKTMLGPIWVLLTPLAFIVLLGLLFSALGANEIERFIPHLTIGFIVWTYIAEIIGSSSGLYIRSKSILLSGSINHAVLYLRLIATALIKLLHQALLIVAVIIYFEVELSTNLLMLIPGLILLLIHSCWVSVLVSLAAVRVPDLREITGLFMRIAFLATPIIWMPGESVRGKLVDSYLLYNPFYHVLESVRAAILPGDYPYQSVYISMAIAATGLIAAALVYNRFKYKAILWV